MAHHVMHKGYDKVPGIPKRYTSAGFAKGGRRALDWFDWISPEAWHHEHNVLHHFRLNELADPDLVEHNLAWLRVKPWPRSVKLALIAVVASVWKPAYYAPNTLSELHVAQMRRAEKQGPAEETGGVSLGDSGVWDPRSRLFRELLRKCWLPYAGWHFGVVPALFLPLGPLASASVLTNSLLAEVLTNLHSFLVITTNHAGDDLWRFDEKVGSKAEWRLRQILGSVNFRTGGDLGDFLHGWLNYQIEHHVWPDLSMLQYQRIAPQLRSLCEELGIPYAQESVWRRLRKTLDIMVGDGEMKRA